MQDDIRPGGVQPVQKSGRKPKVIQPLNDLRQTGPVITSFTDEPAEVQAPTTVVSPIMPAKVEPDESVTEPAPEPTDKTAWTTNSVTSDESATTESKKWHQKLFEKLPIGWPPSKRDWLIIGTAVVLLIATGSALYSMTHRDVAPIATKKVKKVAPPAPKIITSNLTGLPVAEATVNDRPVTGIMIENSPDARPQSSLEQAGVVFEAIAEGGITRFLALFQDSQPDYIGPVRSARPYYVQWCLSFDCAYAHVGGSPDGLAGIRSWGVKDLDQFANSGAYHRISSRYAPHNVYTSMAELNQLETSKGLGKPTFTGFTRKTEQLYKAPDPAATGKAAKVQDMRAPAISVSFAMSGFYYDPHFDFDAASNSYKRSQADQPHMIVKQDGSQTQISPKVVVGLIVPMSAGGLTAQGGAYSNYQSVGTGKALIFQDGTVTTVNWSKADIKAPLTFTDDAGKPFGLNAGQTWITAITDASKASYK